MTLIESYPQNGNIDVYIDDDYYLKFDQEVDDNYLSGTYIRMTDIDGNRRIGLSYEKDSSDPTIIYLIPAIGELDVLNDYTIEVKDSIESTTGDPIDEAYLIEFTTNESSVPESDNEPDTIYIDTDTGGDDSATILDGGNPSLDTVDNIESTLFKIVSVEPSKMTITPVLVDVTSTYEFTITITTNGTISGYNTNYILPEILPTHDYNIVVEIDPTDASKFNLVFSSSKLFTKDMVLSLIIGMESLTDSDGNNLDDDYYLDFIINPDIINIRLIASHLGSHNIAYGMSLVASALYRLYYLGYKLSDFNKQSLLRFIMCVVDSLVNGGSGGGANGNIKGFTLGDLSVDYSDDVAKLSSSGNGMDGCIDELLYYADLGAASISIGVKSGDTSRYPHWRREIFVDPRANIFSSPSNIKRGTYIPGSIDDPNVGDD